MRMAVMGAGGLGGFFGGVLARAGQEVALVARGAQLAAIRERGLTVKSGELGDLRLAVPATDDPAEIGAVDLVWFCVKTYDLEAAAERMRPLIGPKTMVLPLQNGVDIAVRLGRFVAPQQILGGVSYVSARVEAPGVIAHAAGLRLVFGELAGGSSPRAERLLEVLRRAGLAAELSPNVRRELWIKFVGACAGSLTALTRLPVGAILACPEGAALYRGVMDEVAAVARASGVNLLDEDGEECFAVVHRSPSLRMSQYYDLEAGRRLELESLNGTLVRLGRERGVPTPLNFAVYAALKPYVDGPPALP
jgi:2-dehydropantoate 2-reductase